MPFPVEVRYARSGDGEIAYAVVGDHPDALLLLFDVFTPIDDYPSLPAAERFLERLLRFRRLVLVNFRGLGLSDPISDASEYPVRHREDVVAVLDAAGIDAVDVLTEGWAGNVGVRLAVHHPARVRSLAMVHPQLQAVRTEDYPYGPTAAEYQAFEDAMADGTIGASDQLAFIAPSSADDPETVEWLNRTMRRGASPQTVRTSFAQGLRDSTRDVLGEVAAPVVVIAREGNLFVPAAGSRWMAERIPGARFVEIPGADHVMFLGDTEPILAEVEEFLVGTRLGRGVERRLLTVLFTDLVDSTGRAAEAGDARWREDLDAHDRLVRATIVRHGGTTVKSTGDGALATFDGPGPALQAAGALADDLAERARFAVHTGEVEIRGEDIGGIGVHLAARVLGVAQPGEVLVSAAVPLLVLGSPFRFSSRGRHELRGIPEAVELFALDGDPEEWG